MEDGAIAAVPTNEINTDDDLRLAITGLMSDGNPAHTHARHRTIAASRTIEVSAEEI
jgi:hypothetical protein